MPLRSLIIIYFGLLLFSCDNEVDVIDVVESKPVIYCLLNLGDSVYSVTLTKTFIDETNIFDLINDPSVVFYSSANITLSALNGNTSLWSTIFSQTDITKEKGIFPSSPGYLYQSVSVFPALDKYGFLGRKFRDVDKFTLSVELPNENINISTSVSVYYPNRIIWPRSVSMIDFYGWEDFIVKINPQSGSSYRQLNMKVRYWEKLVGNKEFMDKEIEFILRKDLQIIDNEIRAPFPLDFFLNKLATNIPKVENLHLRKFVDFDLVLYSGDDVFDTYRESYTFTTDLVGPNWSNIENGIGIFSLIFTHKMEGFTIDQRARDSLALSPITKDLKFLRWE